jgi:holliday junction DNA helicase RuvA
MIGSLRGTYADRLGADALIEVNGVGYRVTLGASTVARLGPLGGEVMVHVHTHVREDALVLFGFVTREERRTFEILLSAHGVGPSLALAILSSLGPDALRVAVTAGDVDALTMVPGVGKKTAARLLIELKSKLSTDDAEYGAAIAALDDSPGAAGAPIDARADVRAALAELGYSADEIKSVVRRLPAEGDASALLKQALALLAGGR